MMKPNLWIIIHMKHFPDTTWHYDTTIASSKVEIEILPCRGYQSKPCPNLPQERGIEHLTPIWDQLLRVEPLKRSLNNVISRHLAYRAAREDLDLSQRHKPNKISKSRQSYRQHRVWLITKHCECRALASLSRQTLQIKDSFPFSPFCYRQQWNRHLGPGLA